MQRLRAVPCDYHGLQSRSKLTTSTVINYAKDLLFTGDQANKLEYARKRQIDAMEFAEKERQYFEIKAKKSIDDERNKDLGKKSGSDSYVKSVDAFGDKSVKLLHSFIGSADNRVIAWWERAYWNWIRYFFTREMLIAKDRYGTKFTVKWNNIRARNESRFSYRVDKNKRHQPYGAMATDDRIWARWMRGHRGQPPTVAEEEYMRTFKKQAMGPHVVGDEEVEDAVIRHIAQIGRASDTLMELDDQHDYDDSIRRTQPMREKDRNPEQEQRERAKAGATWTMGFVRGDLFYNEEDTQTMRAEIGHVFRNREWQDLEYKRQVRMWKAQEPVGKPRDGSFDPGDGDGDPIRHIWDRTDLGIPHHDGVSDLTTPEIERLRVEFEQLEDERLAIRKELGLTDLGDMREGREPIQQDHDHFSPSPISGRFKPRCWEESWGTGGGHKW